MQVFAGGLQFFHGNAQRFSQGFFIRAAKAMMTTVHSYTADQNLQDGPHQDLRRALAEIEKMSRRERG